MKIDGGCLCNYVTYEAEVDPNGVAICHCTDCQTHSGTAYGVVVGIIDEQFQLLSDTLKVYEKIAESGTGRPGRRNAGNDQAARLWQPQIT